MDKVSENLINCRAYQLWDSAGQPRGRDKEFCLLAERELGHSAERTDSSEESADRFGQLAAAR